MRIMLQPGRGHVPVPCAPATARLDEYIQVLAALTGQDKPAQPGSKRGRSG